MNNPVIYDQDEVVDLLRSEINKVGTGVQLANRWGISPKTVRNAMISTDNRILGPAIYQKLGLDRVELYEQRGTRSLCGRKFLVDQIWAALRKAKTTQQLAYQWSTTTGKIRRALKPAGYICDDILKALGYERLVFYRSHTAGTGRNGGV